MKYTIVAEWNDGEPWVHLIQGPDPITAARRALREVARENDWTEGTLETLRIVEILKGHAQPSYLPSYAVNALEFLKVTDPTHWEPRSRGWTPGIGATEGEEEEEPAQGEMWAVVVTTPPPSETFVVSRKPTFDEAKAAAVEWAGGIEWTSRTGGVGHYGERVEIEPAPPERSEEPLTGLRWDEIIETGAFEEWLGPAMGFELNKYGEVEKDRQRFHALTEPVETWLLQALEDIGVRAYSTAGGLIYPSDVKALVAKLVPRRPVREGSREWLPPPRPEQPWMPALAEALTKMVGDLS